MDIINLVNKCEIECQEEFRKIDNLPCITAYINSKKVLDAFQKNKLSENHFNSTTGYGYNDIGRDVIEDIYKDIFEVESALVRSQFISGSHALTVALFALLRPGDLLLSISGLPYDCLAYLLPVLIDLVGTLVTHFPNSSLIVK